MSTADIIIIVVLVLALGAIIATGIIRKRKGCSPCSHCPSRRECTSHTCVKDEQKSVLTAPPSDGNRTIAADDGASRELSNGAVCGSCDGNCAACNSNTLPSGVENQEAQNATDNVENTNN